jgi:hypothetical protein
MSVVWSDEEIGLLEALRPVCNTREIQNVFSKVELQRTMEAISKKSRQLGIVFKDFGIPAMAGLNVDSRKAIQEVLDQREIQFAAIEPQIGLTSAQKASQTAKLRDLSTKILTALKEVRESIPRTSSISTKRQTGKKESLVICLSDNHFGRKIVDEDGIETYNFEIATERVMSTPDQIFAEMTREQLSRIDEVVILLIGDHVDGEGVFPAQEMLLEDHVAEQVKHCVKAFWLMIKAFRKKFPMVRVVTTRGNHGRGGVSPESNWDVMLYQQLELLVDLEADPNLTIKNKYGEYNTFEVKGWKGMIRHKAPQQASTAAGAIKFAGWHGIHQWDFFCFGHFHNWGAMTWCGKPIIKNGSAMGADDYSETLAVHDGPAQVVFTVSEEKVLKTITNIYY